MKRPTVLLLLALLALTAVAGCGGNGDQTAPVVGREVQKEDEDAAQALGFPGFATKNTTRVGGADPVADAAAVARAVYPDESRAGRPDAAVLVDADDWQAAISAAQLAAAPFRFPVLLTDGEDMPAATESALEALAPGGSESAGDAQIVRVGDTAEPEGLKATDVRAADSAGLGRAIDRFATAAGSGTPSRDVIVAPSEAPAFAMPAAGLAAHSGAPVLWTERDELTATTREAIRERRKSRIHVIGPASVISERVVRELEELGPVRRIAGQDPVRNAVAVARHSADGFGWGVVDPGHGLVFASAERPADAAAAALLSSTGKFGPLLVVTDAGALPEPVEAYLLDIQPGYDRDPVRGVYNHGWIVGDADAVAVGVQAKIDGLLEIQPIDTSTAPSS